MITLPTLIPTFILEKGDKVSDITAETYYLIGANGFFLKQKQHLYESITKIPTIPGFEEVTEVIKHDMPMIPLGVIHAVIKFFEQVYAKYKSEAVVILHYKPENNDWRIDVPTQEVGAASIDYDRKTNRKIEGYIRIGSIHSHASMGAFHSGTDDKDEENFDGIHITVGNLDQDQKSFAARFMCAGTSIKREPVNIINDDKFDMPVDFDKWIDNVKEHTYVYSGNSFDHEEGCYYGGMYLGDRSAYEYYQREFGVKDEDVQMALKLEGRKKGVRKKSKSLLERFKGFKSSDIKLLKKKFNIKEVKGEIL